MTQVPQPKPMLSRRISLLLAMSLSVGTAFGGDARRCTAPASRCEVSIRDMLSGKKFLGATFGEEQWGIVVQTVVVDSPAGRAGLRVGDRIRAVNGIDCSKADMRRLKQVLGPARDTGHLTLVVHRLGAIRWVPIQLHNVSREQVDKAVASHLRNAHQANGQPGQR